MSAYAQLATAGATKSLALAKAVGLTVTLAHRGATAVSLYAEKEGEDIQIISDGPMKIEQRVLRLKIPVQSGLVAPTAEAEPITPGDVIAYLGRSYSVLDPVGKVDGGYVYQVRAVEQKRLSQGVA